MAGEFFLLYCTAIVAKNKLPSSLKCKRQHVYLLLADLSAPSLFYSCLRQHPRGAAEPIPTYLGPLLRETPLRLGALQSSFSPQASRSPSLKVTEEKTAFIQRNCPFYYTPRENISWLFLWNTLESSQRASIRPGKVNQGQAGMREKVP